MKITILDGNPIVEDIGYQNYLKKLSDILGRQGHEVAHFVLREMNIQHCCGCFGCWVKKPGECVVQDDSELVRRSIIRSDFVLWASPLCMGYPSALLKKIMDKSIPLLHPYFTVENNETHHLKRYERYPMTGLLIASEPDTDEEDIHLVTDLFRRTALNMKSTLTFSMLTDQPVEQLAEAVASSMPQQYRHTSDPAPTSGVKVTPPKRLAVINGSPRGKKSNTASMLQQIMNGFINGGENRSCRVFHISNPDDQEKSIRIFQEVDCVLLGFPLYTDAMPGMVKEYIEKLAPLRAENSNPAIGFLVQSGFPEAVHSRYIEQYLRKLAKRLKSPYLGTIVRGNGEGTRQMSENKNRMLFDALRSIGSGLGEYGCFDAKLLQRLAGQERFPAFIMPLYKLIITTFVSSYWDSQLKENGVYEMRDAKPYI